MIVGKYFKEPKDYINVMKVSKTYEHLVDMYKFNPIADTSLFPNLQTQYFYRRQDFQTVVPKMYRYVYWGTFNKKLESDVKKVNSRRYKVNQYDETPNISDKLVSKNIDHRHIMELLNGLYLRCGDLIYDSTVPTLSDDVPKPSGMVIQIFYDDDNNSLAFLRCCNGTRVYTSLIPSLNRVTYYDSIVDIKVFNQRSKDFTIDSNSEEVVISFITSTQLSFQFTTVNKKCVMKIENRGFTYKELASLMFPKYIISRTNPSLIRFNVKRFAMYKVTSLMDESYYERCLNYTFGKNFNVLLDTWVIPQCVEYNLGYVRYIDCDARGNCIMFNVLPTQVVITVSLNGIIKNIKPLCNMTSFIINIESDNIYTRYNFYNPSFAKYYNLTWSDIIYPLNVFTPTRRMICSNQLTRCSCVHNKVYVMRVRNGKYVNY